MTSSVETGRTRKAGDAPVRVMIVEDSAVIRGVISRMLRAEDDLEVVTAVTNGQMAVSALDRHEVDVVVLDMEMPVMDGMTALPKLLEKDRHLKILMASTLTMKNAEISLKALSLGAADYVPKPTSTREVSGGDSFRRDLVSKVRALGEARHRFSRASGREAKPVFAATQAKLRKTREITPKVVMIGSSTGGPQALFDVFRTLATVPFNVPILLTQHMPATFTKILAGHLGKILGGDRVQEGEDRRKIEPGRVYLAPGDWHMTVKQGGKGPELRLLQTPPENFCRPSVDPMFRTGAEVYGSRSLVVVLTGMGRDGEKGARVVADKGGTIIAQDEPSSVVWGMPGAVAQAGICNKILPLSEIGAYIGKRVAEGSRE